MIARNSRPNRIAFDTADYTLCFSQQFSVIICDEHAQWRGYTEGLGDGTSGNRGLPAFQASQAPTPHRGVPKGI